MKKIIIAGLFFTFISCQKKLVEGFVSHYTDSFKVHALAKGDREVVYLPMVHVGKPDFYAKVKHTLDSLRAGGYAVFYESIEADKEIDSLERDLVSRKLRRIIGIYPDYANKKLFKILDIKGFVIQTKSNIGIVDSLDIRADLSLNKLIASYEIERGEVTLSEYDLKTPLKNKYKVENLNQVDSDFLTDTIRNNYLVKLVNESEEERIAVIYGAAHMLPLFKGLQKQDSLWRTIPETELKNRRLQSITK